MYDIITIGSATRDGFFRLALKNEKAEDKLKTIKDEGFATGQAVCFALGSKIEVPEVIFSTGGAGTNAAVTFSRQGFKTASIIRVGDDVSGKEVLKDLEKEGAATEFIQIDKEKNTAYSTALITPEGERTILNYRGANDNLSEKEISWEKLNAKWFYLDSLGGNFDLLNHIIDCAAQNQAKIAFNPGGKDLALGLKKLQSVLNQIDIFILNQEEAAGLVDLPYENEREIFKKSDGIIKGIVVMTKGPKGVSVSDGKNLYQAGAPDSAVIDRTGAGDAFGSGFVSGFLQSNGDISFAIQLGTANATSVVQHFGAKKGILRKDEWGEWKKVKVEIKKLT